MAEMKEKYKALKEAITESMESDFWRNENPKCPHCSNICDIQAMEEWRLYEEGDHEITCPACAEKFKIITQVEFSFSTDEQEDMEEESGLLMPEEFRE